MQDDPLCPDARLYNSRIVDSYIKLLKRRYPHVQIDEILDYAGMKMYEVHDQGHWFTQDQIDRFHAVIQSRTGQANIAREAGRFAASPEAMGVLRQFTLGLVGPNKAYEGIGLATARVTKASVYQSRKVAHNCVEITVTPRPGTQEKPFQCENRMGFWEAIAEMFNAQVPHIEHPECLFKGDSVCRYRITWEIQGSAVWKRARDLSVVALPFVGLLFGWLDMHLAMAAVIPGLVSLILGLSLMAAHQEKREIKALLSGFQNTSSDLMEQMEVNYNNARLSNEIGEVITSQTNLEDVLTQVVQIFQKRLNYDRGLIMLANPAATRLIFRAGFGYNQEKLQFLKRTAFQLDRPDAAGLFVTCYKERKPFLINDIREIGQQLSARSLAFAQEMGTQAFICCPIVCEGASLGILAVDNLTSKKPLVASDLSLLRGIAHVIGISLRNAELIEARGRQMRSILLTLAASIDARDPLTAGHSAKVTEYAVGICNELKFDSQFCETVRVAALLHDYGKIGVPDAILKKPGRLTREEYDIVKTHAVKSREILEQIQFAGALSGVPAIAGAHHEKIDGSGYPQGLKGEEIPLGARIIAVADFFEAITAKRHYREPMPLEVAFHLLDKECGVHFEPRIVEAFKSYHRKKFVQDRQEGDLLRSVS
jgi:HD-GYP domain-containing protein (c-di-GMP phosphodiesterase class II)